MWELGIGWGNSYVWLKGIGEVIVMCDWWG